MDIAAAAARVRDIIIQLSIQVGRVGTNQNQNHHGSNERTNKPTVARPV